MFAPKNEGPRVFNIPSGVSFSDGLIDGLLARIDLDDHLALARTHILAPTRRGARTLAEALMAKIDRPIFGPRIITLEDIDTLAPPGPPLPPAIEPTLRLATLTRLVRELSNAMPQVRSEATAISLAGDLAALLDLAQQERVPLERLDEIIPQEHADHWAATAKFLKIIRKAWPEMLSEAGVMDPVARRVALIDRTLAAWKANPPAHPLIVAGSTGSVGISGELICAIANLPQGAVVLPGIDDDLDAASFHDLSERLSPSNDEKARGTPEHPQNGLSRLLLRLGGGDQHLDRARVQDWTTYRSPRASFLSLALRPAPVTDRWNAERQTVIDTAPAAMHNVALIEAESPEDEAAAISIAIREALETPDKSVALITTDRNLARRVTTHLRRWTITPDDSAGTPLSATAPGVYLELAAEWAFGTKLSNDPVPLLALLKHPFSRLGMARHIHLAQLRRIERRAMRRHATGADLDNIRGALKDKPYENFDPWMEALEAVTAQAATLPEQDADLGEAAKLLRDVLNALSVDDTGETELWDEATGKALEDFLDEIETHGGEIGPLPRHRIGAALSAFMGGRSVRQPFANHPRVFIWGTLEARMQSADRVILAALNEDGWPRLPDNDPWMSRGMLRQMGLPPPERRIGLAAHDFQQAFCAKDVILSRARKDEGTPTIPSRWLQRITTLLGDGKERGFSPDTLERMREDGRRYLGHAAWLSLSHKAPSPAKAPEPRPPVSARPVALSITEIETLIRDPYAIYAKHVLRLRGLDTLIPEPDARVRGEIMHRIMELFTLATRKWPSNPAKQATLYAEATEAALNELGDWPSFRLFYRARAERVGPVFLHEEDARRSEGWTPKLIEASANLTFDLPDSSTFELKGRADRLDRNEKGEWAIYDYKGAGSPNAKVVKLGFAPQLPLTGMLLEQGGFENADGKASLLAYMRLGGGKNPVETIALPVSEKPDEIEIFEALINDALPNLRKLLAAFRNPERPYRSQVLQENTAFAGDYDHLARLAEWSLSEGET